ncbi:MAG TPA: radical SAM protein [Bryobacteraceae bacterium]|nr:radical SAM protein [Bryobacteraceae bacterium]
MLILLTHANHLWFDAKQARKMQPYPPLQTLIAAALLRQAGCQVAFLDATFDCDFQAALARLRPDLVVVCEDHFNFLTKMCLLKNRELAFSMARAAAVPAVVASSDASDHVREYLDAGFRGVILGEVENTLLALASSAESDWSGIAGLAFKDAEGAVHYPVPRQPSKNLDALPQPAWDLIDIERYRRAWTEAHGFFSLNMVSSRGCPYRCNWCAKPVYGNTYHYRAPQLVAQEMLHLKTRYRPDRIWFADDIFGLSAQWVRRFADEVERFGAQLPFKMQSRCDLMTRETVGALRRAGCAEVWMGVESGSQRILDAMEKGTRVEHIYEARENLRRHGIRACFFLQFGYLGETHEDIEQTVRMVRETKPDDIGVSVSYPLPRTKFHSLVANQLGAKKNWSESGDLAVMFRAAQSSDFYRRLADSLHSEVKSWTSS